MKTNDYVKYMTETFVKYMNQPKEERAQIKQQKKEQKEAFLYRWFGLLPFVMMDTIRKQRTYLRKSVSVLENRWKE